MRSGGAGQVEEIQCRAVGGQVARVGIPSEHSIQFGKMAMEVAT
jgi:hypothetical protein